MNVKVKENDLLPIPLKNISILGAMIAPVCIANTSSAPSAYGTLESPFSTISFTTVLPARLASLRMAEPVNAFAWYALNNPATASVTTPTSTSH